MTSNIPIFVCGIFSEHLVELWSIRLQELIHSGDCRSMVLLVLETLKGPKVPIASILERRDRELWKLALVWHRPIGGLVLCEAGDWVSHISGLSEQKEAETRKIRKGGFEEKRFDWDVPIIGCHSGLGAPGFCVIGGGMRGSA
jgi:hypothetical protein